jgi:GAF domain-containing protein
VPSHACSTATTSSCATDHQSLVRRVDELSVLYRLTDELYRARSVDDVFDAALNAIINAVGCDRASILLFDEAGATRFVAWRALSESYRKAVDDHSPWMPGDRDPEPVFVESNDDGDGPDLLRDWRSACVWT